MTIGEMVSVGTGLVFIGGTVMGLVYNQMVKPIKEALGLFKIATENDIVNIKKDLLENHKSDQALREKFIELSAKHTQTADSLLEIKSELKDGLTRIFDLIKESENEKGKIATRISVLESKIK